VSDDQPGGIAMAVFRELGTDDQSRARARALETFVFHTALITTNAALYERMEDALRHQVDLNRQKDEFLAAVSHELRTPLASMLGSVETLRRLEGRMDTEAKQKFFTIAHRQGRRLQRLIEELLLTAAVEHRQESLVAEAVDISDLLDEVAEDLAAQAHGRIVVDYVPGTTRATTDPNKLRQVLTNLVENATKYAPTGLIEVAASSAAGERLQIRVVDHGPGIAPEDHGRVFERFVQLDGSSTRAQGGTGLGLYLCRRVAELLEADLSLTDTPGGGATFTLDVPRTLSTAFVPAAARVPADARR
jgi:signal transduction histidine kinase